MYNPYVVGKHVYFRHPTENDVYGKWHEWLSDEETTKYLVDKFWPNSKKGQLHFYESILSGRDRMVLSIVDKESNEHIGICNLSSINWVHRFCDMALIIGEKEYRKGANAFECVSLLLKIAFMRLNLRAVKGSYIESNEFSKKILRILRFKEVGKCDKLCWIDGQYEALILVILHRDDWMKRSGYL